MSKTQLGVLIFTFACFLFWFSADLIRTKPSVTVSPELQQALSPIDPEFDQTTINLISSTRPIPNSSAKPLPTPTSSSSPSPTPKSSPTPTPSPSPTPLPTASASPIVPPSPSP